MRSRIIAGVTALVSAVLVARPVAAQPKPVASVPASPVFKLVKSIGTSGENLQIEALVSRVRTRVEGDAAFYKRLQDAFAQRNFVGARTLIAPVAQLTVDQVWTADLGSRTSSVERASFFRFASNGAVNPFTILVIVGTKGICFGTKAGCEQAFKDIGWEINA